MMTSRKMVRLVLISFLATTAGSLSLAQAQSSAIPFCKPFDVAPNHAAMGKVYYLLPTKSPQLTFRSNARVEKIKGTSNRMIGYLILTTDESMPQATALAGRFCLPIASLTTGDEGPDVHLQNNRWLDGDLFPEIALVVTGARRPVKNKEDGKSVTYGATLETKVTISGQTRPMTIPTKLTLIPASPSSDKMKQGDRIKIQSRFGIKLSDFGVAIGDNMISLGRFSNFIFLDLDLTFSTIQPTYPKPKPPIPPPPQPKKPTE